MLALFGDRISNGEGMFDHLLDILGANGVQDVECVLPLRYPALGVVVGEVDEDLRILLDQRLDRLDCDLIEFRDVDRAQCRHLHELLVVREHLL